jgi:hypothetical protein
VLLRVATLSRLVAAAYGTVQHAAVPVIGEAVAGHISLRVQQLDVKCETKTKDNVFVVLTVSVQYQVCVTTPQWPRDSQPDCADL